NQLTEQLLGERPPGGRQPRTRAGKSVRPALKLPPRPNRIRHVAHPSRVRVMPSSSAGKRSTLAARPESDPEDGLAGESRPVPMTYSNPGRGLKHLHYLVKGLLGPLLTDPAVLASTKAVRTG